MTPYEYHRYARGNIVEDIISEKNGGENYHRLRQDVYIAGYEDKTAGSLIITGAIGRYSGKMFVYSEKNPHYLTGQQFAQFESEELRMQLENDGTLEQTLSFFRNANTDEETQNHSETYLSGATGRVFKYIYWASPERTFTILRKVNGNSDEPTPLNGGKFSLYTEETGGTPYILKTGTTYQTLSDLTPRKDGVFFQGSLPYGVYYLQEDEAPEGYSKPTKRFRFEITADSAQINFVEQE